VWSDLANSAAADTGSGHRLCISICRYLGPWPLQEIRLFIRGLCTCQSFVAFDTSFITPPPLYFAINLAQCMVFPRPLCFFIQHTILVMAISCRGQILVHRSNRSNTEYPLGINSLPPSYIDIYIDTYISLYKLSSPLFRGCAWWLWPTVSRA